MIYVLNVLVLKYILKKIIILLLRGIMKINGQVAYIKNMRIGNLMMKMKKIK